MVFLYKLLTMNRSLPLLAICLGFTLSCKRDLSNEKSNFIPPVISTSASPITAPIQGNVFDENEQPIAGVTIKVGAKTATTDSGGYFRIDDASLDKRASLLTGQKAGYFDIVKSFAATSGVNYQRIKLLRKSLAGTIAGASGGAISLNDGSSLTLSAGAVVKQSDNTPYNGAISVYTAVIDPTARDFPEAIPGSLMANDTLGKRVMLQSYGMLAISLESSDGQPLQVATGKTATLGFNIPASLQSTAPTSIPLWYLDSTGLWKQQGRAFRTGNVYSGEVSHLSFWNCDTAFNTVILNLTVKDSKDRPVQYTLVRLRSASQGSSYGYTDSLGQVSGLVPFNDQLYYSISSAYHCTINSTAQPIGPFTQTANLVVTADDLSLTNVTGRILSCKNDPSAKGYALIYYQDTKYVAPVDPLGNFDIPIVKCGTEGTVTIIGVDSSGRQQGEPQHFDFSSSAIDVGDIKACGVSTSQFVNYTLDGVSYALSDTNSSTFSAIDTTSNFSIHAVNKSLKNSIAFDIPDQDPDKSLLTSLTFNIGNEYIWQTAPGGITVSLTNNPKMAGEYFEGSFAGNFSDNNKQSHEVSCTFRVRRN